MPLWLQHLKAMMMVGVFLFPTSPFTQNKPAGPSKAQKSPQSSAPSPQSFNSVESRILNGGEKHTYPLRLKASDYVKLVVEQGGIDVVVRLVGPDGTVIQEVDSPNGIQGPEPISCIVDQAGGYVIEIEGMEKTAQPGTYELKVESIKPATEQDRAGIEIENLNLKVTKLWQAGNYDQALPLAQQAVEKSEKLSGPESALLAGSLTDLAWIYYRKGNYAKAEPLYVRALAIRERTLGADHLEVAQTLNNLANVCRAKGDYAQAEPLYVRSLAIREKVLGADHPIVAQSLNNLASLYEAKGNYAQAEPLYVRAVAINEKTLGANHPETATSLNNLAGLYQAKGDYAQAEPLYVRALAIREKLLGGEHPQTAISISNLALLYHYKGDYPRAEALYVRALALKEKRLGADHLETATSLINLAGLYQARGDYVRAEPLYLRALAVKEKVLGPDHPETAFSLNNLAGLYQTKGDYAQAEPLYVRALAIREKALGPDHPETAFSLFCLAGLSKNKGDNRQAETLLVRAVAIQEKALGPGHPELANSLNNLAMLYLNKGESTKAEPMLLRALAIKEKALGPNHRAFASSLNSVAAFYSDQGEYARAEPMYLRSLAIREKVFGADHPDVAQSFFNLAGMYSAKGDVGQAITYQVRGNEVSERDLVRNLVSGSEHQKLLYLNKTAGNTDRTLSLQVLSAPQSLAAQQAALTIVLRRKGRALDAMTSAIETLRRRQDPETQKLLDDYASLAGQLSILTLRGPRQQKSEAHLAYLQNLETQREKLEAEISTRSAEFKTEVTPITLEGVQQSIPSNAVLVEYAVYRPLNAKTNTFGERRYVVYVLDQTGKIRFADLGEAARIDQAASAFRQAMSDKRKDTAKTVIPLAQTLDALVMRPVRKLVGRASHLLISPDGMLNLVPFSALADEKGQYLVEKYTLTYLTSGRDLLRLKVKLPAQQSALVIANPDYAMGSGPILAGRHLKPLAFLPGTAKEGQEIQKLLPNATLVVQAKATTEVVKAVQRPEMLHIATHGYFLQDAAPQESPTTDARGIDPVETTDVEKLKIENSLLRSWLFFAGANRGQEASTGILTALEAAQLDLWGTKLVVLSACNTGLGEVKNGDGVFGLRRALVLAGSEAQMMSLWSVSDAGTRELMVEYYTRLKHGEGRSEALRHTQLKMLKDPKRQHPFYWAAFIQSGDWTNLEGK